MFGITRQSFSAWQMNAQKTTGRIKYYDLREAITRRIGNLEKKTSSYVDEKKRLARLTADKKEFELETLKGLHILKEECDQGYIQLTTTLKSLLRGLPSKLAPQIANSKTRDIHKILTKEIDAFLRQASKTRPRKIKPTKKAER